MHAQISPGETLEKTLDLARLVAPGKCTQLLQKRFVGRGMQPVGIERTRQQIRRRKIKLKKHLGPPWSEGFGIHSVNISIGKEAKALEALASLDHCRKGTDRYRVEYIPALHRGRHFQVLLDEEAHFGFILR